MEASRKGHLGAAFVIHDADLEALNRLLKDFGDDIEYTITGKDGISLTFTDVNKLRAFENPRKKGLSISQRGWSIVNHIDVLTYLSIPTGRIMSM